MDLELGGHGTFSGLGVSPTLSRLTNVLFIEVVQLDLKGSNDNLVVQGKLMIHLSTNPSTTATSSRPAGSSFALTSLPPYDSSRSVNNASIDIYSADNYSANNYSADNYSADHYSADNYSANNYSTNNYNYSANNYSANNYSVDNYSINNYSLNNASVYTASVNSASTSSEVTTPIMAISTTILPGTDLEQQQSLPNILTCPVSFGGTSTTNHPQNPPRPSAPGIVSPGQPITNAQHNLNVNEDHYGPLPEGWERGTDPLGPTYYVSRHTRNITRNCPLPNQAVNHHTPEGETNAARDQHSRGILVDDLLEATSGGPNTQRLWNCWHTTWEPWHSGRCQWWYHYGWLG